MLMQLVVDQSSDCPLLLVVIMKIGDDPEMVKMKLRQWAQVVACSVKHSSY